MSTQPPPDLAAHVLPDAHVNASQLRFDHWARIREAANRLRVEPDLGDQVSAEIEHHLNVLAPYEASFAFPGSATITDVRRLLA